MPTGGDIPSNRRAAENIGAPAPNPADLGIREALDVLLEDLSRARLVWDEPWPPDDQPRAVAPSQLLAAAHGLAAVVDFLRRVDRPEPDDRDRPLSELLGALLSLELDGVLVPLLQPKPARGRLPLSVPERATRLLAVAVADAIAEATGMSRQEADRMVAKKLESWGFPFGRDGTSGADQGPAVERFARLRRVLGRSDCPEEERAAYQGQKNMLRELVPVWPGTAGAADRKRAREWLLSILEKEVKSRSGIVSR